jgi:hypothetical protein
MYPDRNHQRVLRRDNGTERGDDASGRLDAHRSRTL